MGWGYIGKYPKVGVVAAEDCSFWPMFGRISDLNCPVAHSRRSLVVDCGAFGQGSFLKKLEGM